MRSIRVTWRDSGALEPCGMSQGRVLSVYHARTAYTEKGATGLADRAPDPSPGEVQIASGRKLVSTVMRPPSSRDTQGQIRVASAFWWSEKKTS